MKNILKYSVMMLLAVLAFTLGACTEEYEYTKVKANGEQVYFRNDISVASMAKDRDTVQVPVNRIQSKGELQVQLQVTQENNSKLSIPNTVTFADGETQTYLVISYDPATTDYGFSEDVTLAITDESLTTQYGNSSCSFKVEMSPWVSIGQGLYKDEAAAKMVFDMEPISSVDIQESVVTEGVYRVVMPYGPGTDFYNTLTVGYKLSWNNAENTSAIIDATDPEHVYLSQDFQMGFNVPFASGETGIVHIFSYAQYYMEQGIPLAAIEAQFPEYFGTLEDGVITLPGRGLSMSTDETLTDKGYLAGNIQVALPGYQFVDYSSSFEYTGRFTDTDGNDYAQGEITLGEIYSIFPFDNTLCLIKLKGSDLRDLFDIIASRGGEAVSHEVRMTIADDKAANLTIDGAPLDDNRIYSIATIDYVANGGDHMTPCLKATERKNSAAFLRDVVINYIEKATQAKRAISALDEVRITPAKPQ